MGVAKGDRIMQALRYVAKVGAEGNLILPRLKLEKGSFVEVIVLVADNKQEIREMMAAAESSLGFWDNPVDDEIWDRA